MYQAIHCPSNTTVALKVYAKCTLSAVTRRLVQREIEIQGRLDHEHIAKLVMQCLGSTQHQSPVVHYLGLLLHKSEQRW